MVMVERYVAIRKVKQIHILMLSNNHFKHLSRLLPHLVPPIDSDLINSFKGKITFLKKANEFNYGPL